MEENGYIEMVKKFGPDLMNKEFLFCGQKFMFIGHAEEDNRLLFQEKDGRLIDFYHTAGFELVDKYPMNLTGEDMIAKLNELGMSEQVCKNTTNKLQIDIYTITSIRDIGPEHGKNRYIFFTNPGTQFLSNTLISTGFESFSQDTEYIWHVPHTLTEIEKTCLLKQNKTLDFKFGKNIYTVRGIGFAHLTRYAHMSDFQDACMNDFQVRNKFGAFEGWIAMDSEKLNWVELPKKSTVDGAVSPVFKDIVMDTLDTFGNGTSVSVTVERK